MAFIEVAQGIEVPECSDGLDLPSDDGEPLETYWHHQQIYLLGDLLNEHWPERSDVFAGGNMFLYYSLQQVRNRDYKGPDFFVVTGVGRYVRKSWITWEENGRYPDVIFELLSPTTKDQDLGPKKDLYEQVFQTPEYFCVDPEEWSLRGWRLNHGRYDPLVPNARGWLWSEVLGVWLGFREGLFQRYPNTWLRFFTAAEVLIPTSEENSAAERQRAEAEHQRAEDKRQQAEAERQRADAERQRADAERQQAEAERLRAEAERLRAETERQRAETEHLRAETEHLRAETAEAENARLRAELEQLRRTIS